jgi:hypothetical protein
MGTRKQHGYKVMSGNAWKREEIISSGVHRRSEVSYSCLNASDRERGVGGCVFVSAQPILAFEKSISGWAALNFSSIYNTYIQEKRWGVLSSPEGKFLDATTQHLRPSFSARPRWACPSVFAGYQTTCTHEGGERKKGRGRESSN